MKDEIIVDSRISELFGESVAAQHKTQTVLKNAQSELQRANSSDPGTVDSVPRTTPKFLYDQYEVMGSSSKCFFCDNKPSNTFYSPLMQDVREKGPHRDMKAYRVCTKCLGRCDRRRSLDHEALCEYVKALEDRGSVRGRVASHPSNALNEVIVRIPERSLTEAMNGVFRFIDGNRELTVSRATVAEGTTLIFLKEISDAS